MIKTFYEKVISGKSIDREEALYLYNGEIDELCFYANKIRIHFCGNKFDLCSIVNAKNGSCSEDCKFCSQSSFYNTGIESYPFIKSGKIIELAEYNYRKGVKRYSLVSSGKKLSKKEIRKAIISIKYIKENTSLKLCASFGLLDYSDFELLKDTGIELIHNNLETSKRNFRNICTTHTIDDKISSINDAKKAGFNICSGGIIGLGETFKDRIDMAFMVKNIGVFSMPVNFLNPIPGTPFENLKIITNDEARRIIAIYRFILPDIFIRLAGGRAILGDNGRSCFLAGANAMITGDMLTTTNSRIDKDIELINDLGFTLDDKLSVK